MTDDHPPKVEDQDEFRTGDGDLTMSRRVPVPSRVLARDEPCADPDNCDVHFPKGTIVGRDPERSSLDHTETEVRQAGGISDEPLEVIKSKLLAEAYGASQKPIEDKNEYFKRQFQGTPDSGIPTQRDWGVRARATAVLRQEAYDRGFSAGTHKALDEAEARVRQYMAGHFSEATIGGVVQALRGGDKGMWGWDRPEVESRPTTPQDGNSIDWSSGFPSAMSKPGPY